MSYRSISIVQLIPNNETYSLECLLCSEPRGHTGVDNDTNIPFILSIQAKVLLFIIILWLKLIHFTYLHTFICPTVALFVQNCEVQDDLNASVHHGGLFERMAASCEELVQELPLLLQTLVIFPSSLFSVPGPPVY